MSNLSQFFAFGGNKIKSIQHVTATQTSISGSFTWSGVTASISAVDPSKTLLICSPSSNGAVYFLRDGVFSTTPSGSLVLTGHGAYLSSSTQISFYGNSISTSAQTFFVVEASMVVQVVEFE